MGLDYTAGCVNLRDVGELLALLAGAPVIPEQRLLRGGKIDFVQTAEQLRAPATILNLRNSADPSDRLFGATSLHFPAANDLEKYDTRRKGVRKWLNQILAAAESQASLPLLVHCTSGKDRTGVVIAGILLVLGVRTELIIEEYLWSDGEVQREWITGAIEGIGEPDQYFDRVDLSALRRKFGFDESL